MLEKHLKYSVKQYLEILQSRGVIYFDRLNSGKVLIKTGKEHRMVELCRSGTADFYVLQSGTVKFIELKRPQRGEQGELQKEFEARVKEQGAEYHLAESLNDVIDAIGLDLYLKDQ